METNYVQIIPRIMVWAEIQEDQLTGPYFFDRQ